MGTSSYDKETAHRRLEGEFVALDNALGVSLLLRQIHAILNRAYAGDTAAIDITLDLATAIERAGLTAKEREALRLVYGESDLIGVEAGAMMGVTRQRVERLCDTASVKIARIYESWSHRGEGYSLTISDMEGGNPSELLSAGRVIAAQTIKEAN